MFKLLSLLASLFSSKAAATKTEAEAPLLLPIDWRRPEFLLPETLEEYQRIFAALQAEAGQRIAHRKEVIAAKKADIAKLVAAGELSPWLAEMRRRKIEKINKEIEQIASANKSELIGGHESFGEEYFAALEANLRANLKEEERVKINKEGRQLSYRVENVCPPVGKPSTIRRVVEFGGRYFLCLTDSLNTHYAHYEHALRCVTDSFAQFTDAELEAVANDQANRPQE